MSTTTRLIMKFLKIIGWFAAFCFLGIVIIFVFITIPSTMGIMTISGGFKYALGVFLFWGVPLVVLAYAIGKYFKKHPLKFANDEELKREDDVLLQATAFSQAALWIYLSLTTEGEIANAFKLVVPTAALLFYSMRAFAKIRNNNLWRYRSAYALIVILLVTPYSLFFTVAQYEHWLTDILVIEGADVTMIFLQMFMISVTSALVGFVGKSLRKRYLS